MHMKDKMSSRKGFTLTEMLMAVLLLALMTLVIGGGVTVVKDAYEKITLRAEADTLTSTVISAVTGELRTASVIEFSDLPADGAEDSNLKIMSFENKDRGYLARFVNQNDKNEKSIFIQPCADESKYLPLLTDKTHTSKLKTKIAISYPLGSVVKDTVTDEIVIDADKFYFIVKITVSTDKKDFSTQEVKIRPVNLS